MKLCNLLYNEMRPQFKCGADPVSAAIGFGAFSSIGNIMGNALSSSQQEDNIAYQIGAQRAENKLNRDWQTAEAEKARQFEAGQTLQQNQFTKDLAFQQQQYNMQNQRMQAFYQSPVYQRQQLQAANINPQVYFGQQSSFSGSSAPVAGLSSAPAGAKGHMPYNVAGLSPISFQPEHLNLGSIISNVTGSIKSLAEAKKLGVETGWIDDQMRAQIRKLTADTDLAQAMSLGQKIMNQLQDAKLPYAYKMAAMEVQKACSEIELNKQNKITSESAAKVNEALAKLHAAQENLTDLQARKAGVELPYAVQMIKSIINKNTADAGLANAQSQTENEFRSTRGSILGLEYAIKHNEVEISDETKKARILDVLQKAVEQKWKTQESYIEYLQKKYNLDTKGVKDIMNILYGWIPFTSKID